MAALGRAGEILFLRHGKGKTDLFEVHRFIEK